MEKKAPDRGTTEKRVPLWIFKELRRLRHRLIQRAGRFTNPQTMKLKIFLEPSEEGDVSAKGTRLVNPAAARRYFSLTKKARCHRLFPPLKFSSLSLISRGSTRRTADPETPRKQRPPDGPGPIHSVSGSFLGQDVFPKEGETGFAMYIQDPEKFFHQKEERL
jgi:hypothetical protein